MRETAIVPTTWREGGLGNPLCQSFGIFGVSQHEVDVRVSCRVTLDAGQGEGRLAVAPVGRPEQREKRRVLRERHQLAVAERPARRREVERDNADLGYEW